MENEFLDFVANVLDVNREDISMESQYGTVKNWDSVMMLNLIMEIEEKYDCSIPIEKIKNGITLKDLYCFIKS